MFVGALVRTYGIFLDTVSDTGNDIFHDVPVVSVGLVVSESHHSPMTLGRVPMDFDNTVIILFA